MIGIARPAAFGDMVMVEMLLDCERNGVMPIWGRANDRAEAAYFFRCARAEAFVEHRLNHAPWCSSCGEEWSWE